jgi:hypothetical protein
MPRRSRQATVGFASVGFAPGAFAAADFSSAIEEDLRPGKYVLRYDRLWRLARHVTDDGWIFGRLGFEYPDTPAVGLWDEDAKDYLRVQPGQLVRYAIDIEARRVAFELKSQTVRPGTFQGNFQALLNKESPYRWRVMLEGVSQPPWEEWRATIARLTSITIRMKRPNPRYPGDLVEHMFEDAKLAAATIGARGDDVDLEDSQLLRESFELAQNYGSINAKGVVAPDGSKEEWRSSEEGAVEKAKVARDPESQDIPPDEFRRILRERRGEQT